MYRFLTLFAALAILIPPLRAQDTSSGVLAKPLGGAKFESWSGLHPSAEGATLEIPGEALWRHPDGARGFYRHGFRVLNDSAADWHDFFGLQMEVQLEGGQSVELDVTLSPASKEGLGNPTRAKTTLQGAGWHTVTLPWTAFDAPAARRDFLLAVKQVGIAVKAAPGSATKISLRNVRVVKGAVLSLQAEVKGKAAKAGGAVEYPVSVGNVTGAPQSVALSFAPYGWEAMSATVEPAQLSLAPGESKPVTVRVQIPEKIPPGGHETQTLQAIANGDAANAAKLVLITASELPHPNILHTPAGWDEVRTKVKKYDWARAAQDVLVRKAEAWQVPEIARPPQNDPDDNYGPFVFPTVAEHDVMSSAISWQLTRNKAYAQKVAEFLRRLSNPESGYPKTLRACNQGLVQEGHFFQHMAMSYDMIFDSGVLSDADRRQIEATFRLLAETMNRASLNGSINNWNVSEVTGAFYCSLALEDLTRAERFFSGPAGLCDQLAKGTMDDGWWYECAISYNTWVASEFSQVAIALQPWGVNFKDLWLPANYSPDALLSAELSGGGKVSEGPGQGKNRPFGMAPEIWGPIRRPQRTITDLWNSLLPFIDYRGVMFGVNDSTENLIVGSRSEIEGQPFELAYYLFRDPAYAALVKLGAQRDLLYGVPELPEKTPERFRDSAFADNVGLVMLRSQTENRSIREQIQAVLHYGTHGWAHGHYDRTDLLSLMRYGRSFYNPEMIWFGYEPFMYKFYVQTSVSHNMVVVDQKNQEATPGHRLLFHTGKMMQAAVVETTARWSNPPYGGMVYDYVPVKTFEEKTWREGRSVPIPAKAPGYGTLTGYTEPVLQRRLMVVTDDYVVLADYLKGDQPHTFESLFQMKGFQGLEAAGKKLLRHDAQWNPDPVGSAQFVTDCDWYSVQAPAKSRFEMRFGPGADNEGTRALASEDGLLRLDVYSLWPKAQEIMIGTAPEPHEVQKRLYYTVRGDGKALAEGKFGAWILGRGDIDVPLEGVKQLELETKVELSKQPTVFWGSARIVTADGKEIPLSEFAPQFQNTKQPAKPGEDYFGGPIKILGEEQQTAVPGQPQDEKQAALVRVDLAGRDAVRFKAALGSDYPLGNEAQRRKTYAIRAPGKSNTARFLSVIEPTEGKPMVVKAEALGADKLRVELADGRTQEMTIEGFDGSGKDIKVGLVETRDGRPTRSETTAATGP